MTRGLGSILLSYTLPVLVCSVVFNIPRLIRFSPLYNYLGDDPTFVQVNLFAKFVIQHWRCPCFIFEN
jgi:hypothetical protein